MKNLVCRSIAAMGFWCLAALQGHAQSKAQDELYAKAKTEGRVVLYSTLTERNIDPMIAAFSAKYPGIKVEFTRLNSGGIVQRFSAEKQSNARTADVIHHAATGFHLDALKKGWLTKIDDETLGDFPRGHIHPELGPMVAQHLVLLSFNSKLVPVAQAPKTWEELGDPKWRGKMLFLDPRDSEYMVMVLGGLIDSGLGEAWLQSIRDQRLRFPPGGSVPGNELMAAGEAMIFPFNNGLVLKSAIATGAPLAYTVPSPQTGPVTSLGLNSQPQNPNAARLLAHFMLSEQGSKALYSGDEGIAATPYTQGNFNVKFLPFDLKYYQPEQRKRIYDLLGLK
jgi:iron(III) transport system substrate-binding protein